MAKYVFSPEDAVETTLAAAMTAVAPADGGYIEVVSTAGWVDPGTDEVAIALVDFGRAVAGVPQVEPVEYTGIDLVSGPNPRLTGIDRGALAKIHALGAKVVPGGSKAFLDALAQYDAAGRFLKRQAIDPTDGVAGVPPMVVDEATTNLITNPSFEVDTTGWAAHDASTTIARTVAHQRFGAAGLNITSQAAGQRRARTDTYILAASSPHVLSCWAKGAAGKLLYLGVFNATNSGLAAQGTFVMDGTWQRFYLPFQSLGNPAEGIRFRIGHDNSANGDVIYIDGVQVEQKTYATTYCDGSFGPGYTWTGTPHASSSTRTGGLKVLAALAGAGGFYPTSAGQELAQAAYTGDQVGLSGARTILTGTTVTVNVGNRGLELIGQCHVRKQTTTGYVDMVIWDVTANAQVEGIWPDVAAGAEWDMLLIARYWPVPGPRTFELRMTCESGTVDTDAHLNYPTRLRVLEV